MTALAVGTEYGDERADRREVLFEEVPLDRTGRPGGVGFGVLVHATMAAVSLEASYEGVEAVAHAQGRLLGAHEDEVAAATDAVHAALSHPLLRRAAEAARKGNIRRETPVMLRLNDASLAEGVVDLAFMENESGRTVWTVVDFKTDRDLAGKRDHYQRQVRLYARAIEAATGCPASPVLLAV